MPCPGGRRCCERGAAGGPARRTPPSPYCVCSGQRHETSPYAAPSCSVNTHTHTMLSLPLSHTHTHTHTQHHTHTHPTRLCSPYLSPTHTLCSLYLPLSTTHI